MEKEAIVKIIEGMSGAPNEEGRWIGDPIAAPLILRLYKSAPDYFLGLGSDDECKSKIIRTIKQISGIEIPSEYSLFFWRSDKGIRVVEKLDKKLPKLPEMRKKI